MQNNKANNYLSGQATVFIKIIYFGFIPKGKNIQASMILYKRELGCYIGKS